MPHALDCFCVVSSCRQSSRPGFRDRGSGSVACSEAESSEGSAAETPAVDLLAATADVRAHCVPSSGVGGVGVRRRRKRWGGGPIRAQVPCPRRTRASAPAPRAPPLGHRTLRAECCDTGALFQPLNVKSTVSASWTRRPNIFALLPAHNLGGSTRTSITDPTCVRQKGTKVQYFWVVQNFRVGQATQTTSSLLRVARLSFCAMHGCAQCAGRRAQSNAIKLVLCPSARAQVTWPENTAASRAKSLAIAQSLGAGRISKT